MSCRHTVRGRISSGLCPVPKHGLLAEVETRPTRWCSECERGYTIRDDHLVIDRLGRHEMVCDPWVLDRDGGWFEMVIANVLEVFDSMI